MPQKIEMKKPFVEGAWKAGMHVSEFIRQGGLFSFVKCPFWHKIEAAKMSVSSRTDLLGVQ